MIVLVLLRPLTGWAIMGVFRRQPKTSTEHNKAHLFILLVLLAVVFTPQLVIWAGVLNTAPFMANDSPSYHRSGQALLYNRTFSLSSEQVEIPQVIRTPGYPAFLAAVYAVAGPNTAAAVLAQLFINLFTGLLVYAIARLLFGPTSIALIGVAVFATDLLSWGQSFLLLTETLFTFFLTLMLLAGIKLTASVKAKRTLLYALLFGLLLAITTLIRPLTYYLALPLSVYLVFLAIRKHWRWKMGVAALALFVLPFLLLVGGWQLRNYRHTGNADISHIEGINILFYRAAAVVALRDGISLAEARQQLAGGEKDDLIAQIANNPANGLAKQWKEQGAAILLDHPLLFARTQLTGVITMTLGTGDGVFSRLLVGTPSNGGPLGDLLRLAPGEYLRKWLIDAPLPWMLFVFGLIHTFFLYSGGAYWLWRSLLARQFTLPHLLCWGVILYIVLISAGPEAGARFRVPLVPILSVYAAAGWYFIAVRLRPRGTS